MTTKEDLENAYNETLRHHAPVHGAGEANDAFEAYVFTLSLRAAKAEGATIGFETASGESNPSALRFRTSPGRIYSRVHDYTHGVIDFPGGLSYETHIGIYVEGVAGVPHECDVAVLERNEGKFCRRNRVHPKRSTVLMAAECKFYTGKLGIAIGREFLGATADLGSDGRFMISNSNGRSVDRVLAHHKKRRQFELSPESADHETQTIAMFREVFRNARSKRR